MKINKLHRQLTNEEWKWNEAYIHSFMKEDKSVTSSLKENKQKKWKWGNRGRVPYWVRKLNSIFNID
tara:strand:- start:210 stop:410 length:201 start_codon:yes stop_codon:yes gene_type:complete